MKTKQTTSVNSRIRQTFRTRTTIRFRLVSSTVKRQPLQPPAVRPKNAPTTRRNAHQNAHISSMHFLSTRLSHLYPQTASRDASDPYDHPLAQNSANGSRIPATEFPAIGPENHRRRRQSRVRPIASQNWTRDIIYRHPTRGSEPRARRDGRQPSKSTSTSSEVADPTPRRAEPKREIQNPFVRSFASIDTDPSVHAVETETKKY